MNKTVAMMGLWSGLAHIVLAVLSLMLLMNFIPPHSPLMTEAEVVQFYQNSPEQIRIGFFVMLFAGCLYLPWTALLAQLIKRIEGSFGMLACMHLSAGTLNVLLFTVPTMVFAAAAFRLDRNPELIYLFHDFGWMLLVGQYSPFLFAPISLGIATLIDKNPEPIFPRWSGYLNLWFAVLIIPGGLIMFFQSGPFAWNGLIAFWVPVAFLGVWFISMFVLARKAIQRIGEE